MDIFGTAVALAGLAPLLTAVAGFVTALAGLVMAIVKLLREMRARRSAGLPPIRQQLSRRQPRPHG
jgi:hypothetical protein